MTRQMKKAVYEAPLTEHFQVELEGVFCGSVDINQNGDNVSIQDHDVNDNFTAVFEQTYGSGEGSSNWE